MEIADRHTHRILTYIEAVSETYELEPDELEAYAEDPQRGGGGASLADVGSELWRMATWSYQKPQESHLE